jgi:urease accessory protein
MALPGRQHGRLWLEFVRHSGQTAIARQRSSPPLQVFGLQRLPGSGGAYLQIVNPGGGLFGGDTAEVVVSVQEGAHVYLTTQAATKVYPAEHGHVSYQRTQLQVGPQAILEYFPLPLIPFARAAYAQETSIEVDPGGIGMIADVLAPGRAARGEYFGYRMLRSRMEGWVAGELALSEQMLLEPHRHDYGGLGLLEGRTHLATLAVLTSRSLGPLIAAWNQRLAAICGEHGGISELAYGGLMVRLLGHTNQEVLRWLDIVHRWVREEGLGLPPLHLYRPFE